MVLLLLSAAIFLAVPGALLALFLLTPTLLCTVSVPLLVLLGAPKRSALGRDGLVRLRNLTPQVRRLAACGRCLLLLPLGGGQRHASGRVALRPSGLVPLLARCCRRVVGCLLSPRLVIVQPGHPCFQAANLSPDLVTSCHALLLFPVRACPVELTHAGQTAAQRSWR